jgi:uncharacterized membrane protein
MGRMSRLEDLSVNWSISQKLIVICCIILSTSNFVFFYRIQDLESRLVRLENLQKKTQSMSEVQIGAVTIILIGLQFMTFPEVYRSYNLLDLKDGNNKLIRVTLLYLRSIMNTM